MSKSVQEHTLNTHTHSGWLVIVAGTRPLHNKFASDFTTVNIKHFSLRQQTLNLQSQGKKKKTIFRNSSLGCLQNLDRNKHDGTLSAMD